MMWRSLVAGVVAVGIGCSVVVDVDVVAAVVSTPDCGG